MPRYLIDDYVDGGMPAEIKMLSSYTAVSVQRETGVPRYLYKNFMDGKKVPNFVRRALEKYIKKKEKEIKLASK